MTQRIASALSYIPADDRNTWVAMAMAIRSEMGEGGFEVWDQWSRTSDSYQAASAQSVWRSCRGHGITLGSLYHEAQQRGWRDDDTYHKPTRQEIEARRDAARERATREGREQLAREQQAAKKAAWILGQTMNEQHAYLHTKGWPEAKGAVWRPDAETNLLCIPMRHQGALVGIQLIDKHGTKKYLSGQRTRGAEYVIDNSGRGAVDWFCEGYATGISLRESLHALRMRYRIHITFSANNLTRLALSTGKGYIVADRDDSMTGEKAAQATGLSYFLSDVAGEDFNDLHKRLGVFKSSQMLRKWINQQEEQS